MSDGIGPSDKQMLLPALPPAKGEVELLTDAIGARLNDLHELCVGSTDQTLSEDAKKAAEICGLMRVDFLRLSRAMESVTAPR